MDKTESERWQILMHSCRKACNILGEEFSEPTYLDWNAGRNYYQRLWGKVRIEKATLRR